MLHALETEYRRARHSEPASVRLAAQLKTIATRHPRTKIVSIVGNKCIENYPDRHLPTLFLYRNGALRRQFTAYGKDKERTIEGMHPFVMIIDALVTEAYRQQNWRCY